MPRIRTVDKAVEEIRRTDPNTCITPYYIRKLIVEGEIHCTKSGNRYLVNVDEVLSYAEGVRVM